MALRRCLLQLHTTTGGLLSRTACLSALTHGGAALPFQTWGPPAEHGALLNDACAFPAATWLRNAAAYGVAAQQATSPDAEVYRVSVVTGNVRGAGTSSAAWVQLIGVNGESEKAVVGNSLDDGIARNTVLTFDVSAPRGLGGLRRLYVERERSHSSDTGDGWYLDHVDVQGPAGERYFFPCHSWFGHSDSGDYFGPLERNLIPSTAETLMLPEQVVSDPVTVAASGVAFPHPEKVLKNRIRGVNMRSFGYGGEDAYFYVTGRNNIFGMGVADGVYMWKELGIDSGTFSRTLIRTAQHMVEAGIEDVFKVLQVAARHVESEGVQGSSTACLLTINQSIGRLHAANLGDSGFFVFTQDQGGWDIRFRTSQLEHEFGRPYQLGHHQYANRVTDAELATITISKGDVIVMGTDGLLDNLSEHEILDHVARLRSAGARPPAMVQAIAKAAFEASMDRQRSTPYSKAATEAFDMCFSGGKPDDISIVVAVCS